jgi:ATP-dependent helicase HrpA
VLALETEAAQAAAMRTGTRRLLSLTIASPARGAERALGSRATLALASAPHGSLTAVLADAAATAIDDLGDAAGGPAWDEAGFETLRTRVAAGLAQRTAEIVQEIAGILELRRTIHDRLAALAGVPGLEPAVLDVARQLGSLVFAGFATATGAARLPDVRRYLEAAVRRLERLPDMRAQDGDRMRVVAELERDQRGLLAAGRPVEELGWMIQELRVSSFAQGLGVRGPVSVKRVRRALQDAARE